MKVIKSCADSALFPSLALLLQELRRETLADAFQAQKQIDAISRVPARENLRKILGPDLYNSWNEGRGLQYELELHP